MSAIRLIVARNQITSPASARATSSFSPPSVVRPVRTKRSASKILARSSAAAGSASMILAASSVSNRAHGRVATGPATAASTCAAASRDGAGWPGPPSGPATPAPHRPAPGSRSAAADAADPTHRRSTPARRRSWCAAGHPAPPPRTPRRPGCPPHPAAGPVPGLAPAPGSNRPDGADRPSARPAAGVGTLVRPQSDGRPTPLRLPPRCPAHPPHNRTYRRYKTDGLTFLGHNPVPHRRSERQRSSPALGPRIGLLAERSGTTPCPEPGLGRLLASHRQDPPRIQARRQVAPSGRILVV